MIKIGAPEIEGPKILDKIDLSALEKSTRPKKATTTPPAPVVAEQKPVAEKEVPVQEPVQEKKQEEPAPVKPEPTPTPTPVAEPEPEITKIKAERIEGPKILGKIELPVDSDTRPKRDEKRKRKRIPIEKKEVKPDPAAKKPFQQGGGNRDQRNNNNNAGGGGFRGGDRRHHQHPREENKLTKRPSRTKYAKHRLNSAAAVISRKP